ncbi:hypothetical protein SISNIDRAFT_472611 [Sistotremastrum niveocremeum HHB9708]|uniref:Photolyase/cryptochrome alpha/beta domain-containing protein n=1 Tax=Sistotremastrum niveocremeum HHB9708 TaxID=1314777 RepID=A0A164ZF70_9AGAM|nr:hypothetical protein SISNIDRAFT_472611 [Sistotremastrum niveocremeum HHB9708]
MKTRKDVAKGESVIYWMRMQDMRIHDNRAIAMASSQAAQDKIPLIVLFIISPHDFEAHDRGSRRIDFMLRNLSCAKAELDKLHIPLYILTHKPRKDIPRKVLELMESWRATHLYANIEHEVDELRRDIQLFDLATKQNRQCSFLNDKLVVEPGTLKTQNGKEYTIYSPWQRKWLETLNNNLDRIKEAPSPSANNPATRDHSVYGPLFSSPVPEFVEGFQLATEDKARMEKLWPAGTEAAIEVLDRFLHTKSRLSQVGDSSPLAPGAEKSDTKSRILVYADDRNRSDMDTSSRMSPYLASGVISARYCIRKTMELLGKKTVEGTRGSGVGMWVQEVAWRDFYTHILAAFPRVSMGRPFQEKFAGVKWETDKKHLEAWKEGKTGVPIVDAAMRQAKTQGWMHNRPRMIAAMYLTKDLMIDWRLGEKYFMEQFVDGDLASNNGGWQWSASTGTDAQPYFRIFNPYLQSEKADPSGDYIRHFVPELRKLKGKVLHDPVSHMPRHEFEKLGYPRPLVDHKVARERAVRRYKTPGEE